MSTQIEKFTAIADKIREKTGTEDTMTANDFVDKIDDVYSAGQSSMVDENKIISKTVSGVGALHLNDVSEIPHKIDCKVESVNLFNIPDMETTIETEEATNVTFFSSQGVISMSGIYEEPNSYGALFSSIGTCIGNYATSTPITETYGAFSLPKGTYTFYADETQDEVARLLVGSLNASSKNGDAIMYKSNSTFTVDNDTYALLCFQFYTSDTIENFTYTVKPMLNRGTEALPYTPYVAPESVEVTVTNDDGSYEQTYTYETIKDMVSTHETSPIMNIIASNPNVNITVNYNKSYGMNTQLNRIWKQLQNYGTRTDYTSAFAYSVWDSDSFKPPYDIKPTSSTGDGSASCLFKLAAKSSTSRLIDLEAVENECGISFDFSTCNNLSYAFADAGALKKLNVVDVRKCNIGERLNYAFYGGYGSNIECINKIICDENSSFANTTFNNMTKLKEIRFEGTIGKSGITFASSKKLSHDSIKSIINSLSEETQGLTLTLSKTAVNKAFETSEGAADGENSEEWINSRATKTNWTITLL